MKHDVSTRQRPYWMNRVLEFVKPRKVMFAMMTGAGLGMATVNFTIVQPMIRQVEAVRQDMANLGARMNRLSAVRGSVYESNDLLAALEAQQETTIGARAALSSIRQLRAEVDQESRRTAAALDRFADLAALQARVLDAGSRTAELEAALDDVDALQNRTSLLGQAAAARVEAVQQADEALVRLDELKDRVLAASADLEKAHAVWSSSQELQQSLAAAADSTGEAACHADAMIGLTAKLQGVQGAELESSSENATHLLALHDMLADGESLSFDSAERNLRTMLETQNQLARSSEGMVAAAENLELLTEFQRQLAIELEGVRQLRHQLTEMAFLRDAVDSVSEMMAPLTELSTLKRLNDEEIRSMARQILDRRTVKADAAPSVESLFSLPEATAEGVIEKPAPTPVQE